VQKLQTALHAKAKEEPSFRFYALYDKLYREYVLAHAWRLAKANGGAAGVDGQTFRDVEEYGVERWLGELEKKTYCPQPVRRVYIPKPDGRKRPLGISTIRDRVVETIADLRSRSATGAVCVQARSQRARRGAAHSQPAQHGISGRRRRRPGGLCGNNSWR
jgi:hypothetical protein